MGSSPRIVADSLARRERSSSASRCPAISRRPREVLQARRRASRPPMELGTPATSRASGPPTSCRTHRSTRPSHRRAPSDRKPAERRPEADPGRSRRARSLDAANDRSAWPRRSARPPRRVVPAWRSPGGAGVERPSPVPRCATAIAARANRRPRRNGHRRSRRHDAHRHEDLPRHPERHLGPLAIEHEPAQQAPRAFGGHHALTNRRRTTSPATAIASITPVPTRRSPPRTTAGRDPVRVRRATRRPVA